MRFALAIVASTFLVSAPAFAAKSHPLDGVALARYADPANRFEGFPAWARLAFKSDNAGNGGEGL